jgi:hypothetical protein
LTFSLVLGVLAINQDVPLLHRHRRWCRVTFGVAVEGVGVRQVVDNLRTWAKTALAAL